MSDAALNAIPTDLLTYQLTDQFLVQRASKEDLSEVLAIYNQSIPSKQATANLALVTVDERAAWFDEHLSSLTRPIYVVKMAREDGDTAPAKSQVVAWGSFSDLYARTAYHISTEVSIYLNQDYQGKGLGSLLTRWMLTEAPNLGIRNVIALVFAHNQPSLGLFRKLGFEQWGYMPAVCDMEGFIADVVMLGKAVTSDDISDKASETI
ncbi:MULTISPECIES: GNAT family N-acetyltransferase [unclassified Psychrobacter]|uniref:GNAT family N-acetyltransferase n=1 Tax=unclassified Psychrobacter TaxID=196806 RepID=UPI0025B36087|nr:MULTISPECIES: GNAT family N-acetyltransferase [unclassified Psychrobacter]MDN3452630.1 GNAT family N-acetyltransferase [Psychrobacter sp. APC 3350]MDN3502721.1 GNAT family N-acetyltransferase [Psychrobacter sp. 5A.1]